MNDFKIDRHPLVWQDIDDIAFYIGDYVGFDIAERKTYEIERSIDHLRHFPNVGTVRNEIIKGLRVMPSSEKAVICFTVDDDARTVRIVCVTYAGQDWQRIAKSRE